MLTDRDYREIEQLYSRFHLGVDLGNIEQYVATFASDGYFEVLGLPEGAPAAGRTIGHDALRAMVKKLVAGLQGNSRHFTSPTSTIIEGDHNEARAVGYLFEIRPGIFPHVGVFLSGIFRDRIVKVDGRWLFAEKTIQMDPQPEAGANPTDVLVAAFDRVTRENLR